MESHIIKPGTDDIAIESSNKTSKFASEPNDTSGSVLVDDAVTIESQPTNKSFIPARAKSARSVLYLSFTSLGAIYGDIGTSPMYTVNTVLNYTQSPPRDDVYGAISCIFWLFTLVVIFKYCLVVLYFGPNNGEGGQVAIYAKIARFLHIGPQGVTLPGSREFDDMLLITRSETHDSMMTTSSSIHKKRRFNKYFIDTYLSKFIMGLCFFGCGLVMSDGLLTPTTSVLSAVDGLAVAVPSLEDKVLPVSCVILLVLFSIQKYGSSKISVLFAPIIFIWLLVLAITGIMNIVQYDRAIFKALNPAEAIYYLKRQKDIDVLSSAMLALTGTEAMFADIGHFSRLSIQLTLASFVYPCLMLAYLGQGAFLIEHPSSISNLFFLSIPGGTNTPLYWFIFALSTLASIIASQALILGVFSILRQMIHIDCFPAFKVVHMNSKNHGQIFLPTVNFILMVAVICTTVGFRTSANVTAAYGLGVAMDFFVTTNLITICLLYVYGANVFLCAAFYLIFGALDLCLVISGLRKVPHGAWFPLMMAFLVFFFICFWRWGRSLKLKQEYGSRVRLRDIFLKDAPKSTTVQLGRAHKSADQAIPSREEVSRKDIDNNVLMLSADQCNGKPIRVVRYDGIAIMFTNVMHTLNSPNTVPSLFKHILTSFPAIPDKFIFLGIRVTTTPYVEEEDRIMVEQMRAIRGLYRCIVRFGFMDRVKITNSVVAEIIARIKVNEIDEEVTDYNLQDLKTCFIKEDGHLTKSVLHIFETEDVSADRFSNTIDAQTNLIKKNLFKSVIFLRSTLIEQIFSPLSNLFQTLDHLLAVSDEQEVLYIGNRVKI